MANEQTERPPLEGASVQLTAPGVPYSAIIVPFSRAGVAAGIAMCKYLADEWRAAFKSSGQAGSALVQVLAPPPRPAPRPQSDAIAFCADHDMAPCRPSAPQYNKDGDKFYHPLDEADWYEDNRGAKVKNHSLYWRLTVDADGESNAGKVIPGVLHGPTGQVVVMPGGDEYIEPDDLPF